MVIILKIKWYKLNLKKVQESRFCCAGKSFVKEVMVKEMDGMVVRESDSGVAQLYLY